MIIDAHCDLAWNMLTFGRDYTRSVAETRALEKGSSIPDENGDTLIGWPEYQKGQVAIVFSTLFAAPKRSQVGEWDKLVYSDQEEAHRLYIQELRLYHQLVDSKPEHFRLITRSKDLAAHLAEWRAPEADGRPVGLVPLMEGADGIRGVEDLAEWHELGLRIIGLAWTGTRYAGGTREPGPLTPEGRKLLKAMADFNFILDLTHMDEESALEALDLYPGPVIATHTNCLALLPGYPNNRHFSDRVMAGIIQRGGVVGNVLLNTFLKSGWSRKSGSRREEVPLETLVNHLDHICQLAGDSLHSGIGSDFDGGFGVQSVPVEIDTVADLNKIGELLGKRGYSATDTANILGMNWLKLLEKNLPA